MSGGGAEYMVLNNIVQYASKDMRVVMMAKVDAQRTDHLQQAEELAHFAQAWESGTKHYCRKMYRTLPGSRDFARLEYVMNVVRLAT